MEPKVLTHPFSKKKKKELGQVNKFFSRLVTIVVLHEFERQCIPIWPHTTLIEPPQSDLTRSITTVATTMKLLPRSGKATTNTTNVGLSLTCLNFSISIHNLNLLRGLKKSFLSSSLALNCPLESLS